jgi:chemotaxis protein histidine kinase CheA
VTHLVRNSISHGIELPPERDAAGKDPLGHLSIVCRDAKGVATIEYSDDGRGFDFERLTATAGSGLSGDQAAFADGVTTTNGDELSGRGVGLSAVREELASAGYEVELANSESGGGLATIRPASSTSRPTLGSLLSS